MNNEQNVFVVNDLTNSLMEQIDYIPRVGEFICIKNKKKGKSTIVYEVVSIFYKTFDRKVTGMKGKVLYGYDRENNVYVLVRESNRKAVFLQKIEVEDEE